MPKLLLPLIAALAVGGSATAGGIYLATRDAGVEETTRPPSVLDTPEPSPTATVVQTATAMALPERTPTPLPGGKAPEGCVSTEKSYVDPDGRFAFCYPSDMELVTAKSGAPTVMHPLDEDNRVVVNIGWSPQRWSLTGEPCLDSPLAILNRAVRGFTISGKNVEACFQDHYERDEAGSPAELSYRTIQMEVPSAGGFVQIDAAYTGPDFKRDGVPVSEISDRILDSATIY